MRVAVILTARPSWSKLEPVCAALQARPGVELQIIACASALLERYGRVVDVVTAQGYPVAAEIWSTYEGENLITSAKETGALLTECASVLRGLRIQAAVVCADRHEVLAAAQSVSYLHLPLVHVQGGERTGSIDDRVRDAITALADYHCVATEQAKYRVYALTGQWERIYQTGCPSIDVAQRAQSQPPVTLEELGGHGSRLDLNQPFVLVVKHPVTSEAGQAYGQMWATLEATQHWPCLVLWPGQDAGSGDSSKAIRVWMDEHPERVVHTVRNLPPERFLRLMTQAACMVGNSSASVREGSFLGVPAVVIGSRQHGRERGPNVVDVGHDVGQIRRAVEQQIAHGRYPSSDLYGCGDAGEAIANVCVGIGAGALGEQGLSR